MTAQEWWDAVRDAAGRIAEREVLKWFFGSRFACDARPDRCAKCPAQMRSSTQEEKNLYENMLARMSTPIDVDIFAL